MNQFQSVHHNSVIDNQLFSPNVKKKERIYRNKQFTIGSSLVVQSIHNQQFIKLNGYRKSEYHNKNQNIRINIRILNK